MSLAAACSLQNLMQSSRAKQLISSRLHSASETGLQRRVKPQVSPRQTREHLQALAHYADVCQEHSVE